MRTGSEELFDFGLGSTRGNTAAFSDIQLINGHPGCAPEQQAFLPVQLENHRAHRFQAVRGKAVRLDSANGKEVGWCKCLHNIGNRDALRA